MFCPFFRNTGKGLLKLQNKFFPFSESIFCSISRSPQDSQHYLTSKFGHFVNIKDDGADGKFIL